MTGNKDNPRGARRVPPFDQSHVPEKAIIEMYSMPNGEQEQDPEGEASGGDSGEWESDGGGDEESDDPSDEEEVESPPRRERRSKLDQERPSAREKAIAQAGQSSKRPRTSSPTPTEKAPKNPKVAEPKLRKALLKIKIDIPVASA
ncbi:ATP-dependent RNA helicase mak-5-like [Triticum urartu]|uniref:ATP-dependent RNA helicase mak-5-like n=1 Tax=Triticum urartu TaxID=4572 RepID=UPI002042F6E5|nr:ATP-dependent RNA helicase mak-5-like [Triticum urartu]XP_048547927.1 ATP-dependent RNA helicase mak-5-like [Triticum urartu]